LSVGLLSIIFLNQRSGEIGLLLAIGYSKLYVTKKLLLEMIIQIIFGWVFGLIFTSLVYIYLNQVVFDPKAIIGLNLWQLQTFYSSVPIPISVIAFTIGFVSYKINLFDPIYILEK
jgi:ABC-type antimicrobial peptide transport system permease subunit